MKRRVSLCWLCCAVIDQVRVHHKKTKHEYRFSLAGDPPEVGACTFHPNPAGSANPKEFVEDAKAAAEWFVANKRDVSRRPVPETRAGHGWVSV